MYQLANALFPSRARRAVLLGLFGPGGKGATVSELARRAGLTPRAVAVEVRRLTAAGLVEVEAKGAADLVRPCRGHPAARALSELLKQAASASKMPHRDPRPSLAAYGAPLAGVEPVPEMPREQALVAGLLEARTDPTVLRVLPVMVLRNEARFDWDDVRSRARRAKVKAELGMLLDLTAAVSGHVNLHEQTHGLADHRRRVPRYLPEPASEFERRLADKRTPPAARRWGFRVNMSEVSVGEFVRKHFA
jgi:DNA-binding transcriptional ArsR family regulator